MLNVAKSAPLRVFVVALGLTVLSFAVGVAGDLSNAPTQQDYSGPRVVLQIPPEVPAVEAAPLPQERAERSRRREARVRRPALLATAAAEAAESGPPNPVFEAAMRAELAHSLPFEPASEAAVG